ncbi:MAG: ferritin-like protein [Kofleriaceae bacterium]
MKEPEIVVQHREQLTYLLTEAAEIEHGLMCCYLYAAMSLKRGERDGLTAAQAAVVDRWRAELGAVAREEMLHLALVNNILTACGFGAHFGRLNLPVSPGYHPAGIVVALAPLDAATLDHFIYLERPEGVELPDGAGFAPAQHYQRPTPTDRLMAHAQDYLTVGHFYRGIEAALVDLAERMGEARLFCGDRAAQVDQALFPLPGIEPVVCLATARAALERIVEQGEGSSAASKTSHYCRFLAIREELAAMTAADPSFQPAHPAARNPLMRPPVDPVGRVFIDEPAAARVVDLANAMYGHSLRLLQRVYAPVGDTPQVQAAHAGRRSS